MFAEPLTPEFRNGWYWCDSRYACAGVLVRNGVIVEAAPIFRKLVGQTAARVRRTYKLLWSCDAD